MNRRLLTVFIAMSLSWSNLHAGYWKDSNGNPHPDTESRRSVGEFGGSLLITSDPDWEKKWDTSPETIPVFNEAKVATQGKWCGFHDHPDTHSTNIRTLIPR